MALSQKKGFTWKVEVLSITKKIGEKIGFASVAFLQYDLKDIKGSLRTRFYYALQGRRGEKGVIERLGAKKFSDALILIDYETIEPLKVFFDQWKIEYRVIPALIPKRLKKVLLN